MNVINIVKVVDIRETVYEDKLLEVPLSILYNFQIGSGYFSNTDFHNILHLMHHNFHIVYYTCSWNI